MTAYPTITDKELSAFSGRPEASYGPYHKTAVSQAILLFKLGTCLAQLPDEGTVEYDLAMNGLLEMADSIVLAQKYQKIKASPFSSESIGSYSYSKAAKAVSKGQETGIMWFDMALQRLSVCETADDVPMSGGIEVFEFDFSTAPGQSKGNVRMLGPADLNASRAFGYDPAPGYVGVPQQASPASGSSGFVDDPDNPGYMIEG